VRPREVTVPPRILVVEYEADVADLIRAVLIEEGYLVAVARDGADGLQMAQEWHPDLILLDLQLPKLDGSELLKSLREQPSTAETPVVAMSASENIRQHTGELRAADAALSKPFDIDALLTQVAFHLARRSPPEDTL
jgi:DNA-binding response OmpR family regulator